MVLYALTLPMFVAQSVCVKKLIYWLPHALYLLDPPLSTSRISKSKHETLKVLLDDSSPNSNAL